SANLPPQRRCPESGSLRSHESAPRSAGGVYRQRHARCDGVSGDLEMTLQKLLMTAPLVLLPGILMGQGKGVAPAELLKPLRESWPTYNGDYSGKRYSALNQVNQSNVKHLTLAWAARVTSGMGNAGGGGRGGRGGGGFGGGNIIVGGEGTGDLATGGGTIKGSVL